MKKFLKNLFMFALILFGVLSINVKDIKADTLLPQIAFVGLDHYPLLDGETDTIYLTSKDYIGKVQYQIFMTKDEGEWYPLTDYLPAVDSTEPFAYKIPDAFSKGSYRMAIRVKRANTVGMYKNKYGAFDTAYPFNVECVAKDSNNEISSNGDILTDKEQYGKGDTIKILGIKDINGINSPYTYKINVYDTLKNQWLQNLGDYSDNPEWIPTASGQYIVDLWVKSNKSSSNGYEAWKLKTINVGEISNSLVINNIEDIKTTILKDEKFSLPKKVTAFISDGTQKDLDITWSGQTIDTSKTGTYVSEGTVERYSKKVKYTLEVSDDSKKIIYQAILDGINNLSDTVDVSKYTKDDIKTEFNMVISEHPEIFYLDRVNTRINQSAGTIHLAYLYPKTEVKTMKKQLDNNIADILSKCVKPGYSDYDKELAIHDYIVTNSEYDDKNEKNGTIPYLSHTAYGIIVNKIGVCDGYSYAMNILLNKAGVETIVVLGKGTNNQGHAWNIVKIGGKLYNLDTTQDDPVPDQKGIASHEYFNITDEQLAKDHSWDSFYPKCTSTDANYFVKNNLISNSRVDFYNIVKKALENRKLTIECKVKDFDKDTYLPIFWEVIRNNPSVNVDIYNNKYAYDPNSGILTLYICYR